MKLKQALFQMPDVSIFQVDADDGSFLNWKVEPIIAPTLAANYVRDKILDGLFILKAVHISAEGKLEDCYLDVVMPERISETAYLQREGEIIEIKSYNAGGEIIPTVAIEGFGLYELFYSRLQPEIGLSVLRNGLKVAKQKGYIAEDMAYILRDENRKLEAIEAFDIVIAEGEPNEYTYLERAGLLEETGDLAGAIRDREEAARIVKTRPTIHWT
jgi:tetratricopeptide (TPR) repeat protein